MKKMNREIFANRVFEISNSQDIHPDMARSIDTLYIEIYPKEDNLSEVPTDTLNRLYEIEKLRDRRITNDIKSIRLLEMERHVKSLQPEGPESIRDLRAEVSELRNLINEDRRKTDEMFYEIKRRFDGGRK